MGNPTQIFYIGAGANQEVLKLHIRNAAPGFVWTGIPDPFQIFPESGGDGRTIGMWFVVFIGGGEVGFTSFALIP